MHNRNDTRQPYESIICSYCITQQEALHNNRYYTNRNKQMLMFKYTVTFLNIGLKKKKSFRYGSIYCTSLQSTHTHTHTLVGCVYKIFIIIITMACVTQGAATQKFCHP